MRDTISQTIVSDTIDLAAALAMLAMFLVSVLCMVVVKVARDCLCERPLKPTPDERGDDYLHWVWRKGGGRC